MSSTEQGLLDYILLSSRLSDSLNARDVDQYFIVFVVYTRVIPTFVSYCYFGYGLRVSEFTECLFFRREPAASLLRPKKRAKARSGSS